MIRFKFMCIFSVASLHSAFGSVSQIEDAYCDSLSITGGQKASIKDVPFIAWIDGGIYTCGGSIIHELFILTAASCIVGNTTGLNVTVLIGTDTLSENGVFFDVEEILCHEDFDENTLHNDICLLKLTSGIPFAWLVQVALPDQNFAVDVSTWVNVTGWGADDNPDEPTEDQLRQVEIPVLADECCDNYYKWFNDKMICAGSRGLDFCKGDVGGPLTYNGVQIGIVSGEGTCGTHPGAYTRVTSYLDWINYTIITNNV